MRNLFFKSALVSALAIFIVSCDKDFNEIGSDIVGIDHFGLNKDSIFTVVAYDQKMGAVQTSKISSTASVNVPINVLGHYSHAIFGKTTASFVTQLELAVQNPSIGVNPEVKSVELSVPYFSTLDETNADGSHTYELDSIQGSEKIKLSVFASTYFLRDFDPASGFQEAQKYYSDEIAQFNANVEPGRLNDSLIGDFTQNDKFFFDPAEIVTYKEVDGEQVVDKRRAPEMRLWLNKDFFQNKMFGPGAAGKLVNNNVFKDYFRGLFFKAESISDQGSLAAINFTKGKVTITYLVDGTSPTGPDRVERTMVLNMTGNTVNLFENQENASYLDAISNSDVNQGDENLYVKGGEGSMAVVELFGKEDIYRWDDDDNAENEDDPDIENTIRTVPNGVPDELDDLRNNKWLVNDATLSFVIDQAKMGTKDVPATVTTEKEPIRLYLYDLTFNRPLIDYIADGTTFSGEPKKNKYMYGGILEKNVAKKGTRYTFRITNHIRNLIANDTVTNVKLGLVVTETIANTKLAKLKTPTAAGVDRVPEASVAHRFGTVLYGNRPIPGHSQIDVDKEVVKLRIYYTKPDPN